MRVTLKFELDADPDLVWDTLLDPVALASVVAPLVELELVGHHRFPRRWSPGQQVLVRTWALGGLALGDQLIRLDVRERGAARILEDSGGPISGILGVITGWRHRMAVSPTRDGGTLYRDRLDFSAGVLTPVVWPAMWLLWQWRARGVRRVVAARVG